MTSPSLVGKTYLVKTFGCQMNLHDSERVSGLLDSCGCNEAGSLEEADIVVFMTCCVRENADQRLYGQASALVSMPAPPSGKRVVAIGGCIAQRDGVLIKDNVPACDVVFGTSALDKLPQLLEEALASDVRRVFVNTDEEGSSFSTDLPARRAQAFHAWVPIMYGCNNFCTYCIVPHVRGREQSRIFETVVSECARLVDEGVREICLLGQNVNSYGRDLYGSPRFSELIRAVGETGVDRLRFTSSNPKDLDDDVIAAMAETPAVMPHLHLAVQSGSTRILKAMNRSYTREEYLGLVGRLKAAMPDLALTTDVIVGFPGETEEDFLETLSLFEEAQFAGAFTFIYSKRPGTPAAEIDDPTPADVIQGRFDRLAHLVEDLSWKSNQADLGRQIEVLVESTSKRFDDVMVGHSAKNQTVHFSLPEHIPAADLVGKLVTVDIDRARTWYLSGTMVGEAR